MNHNYLYCQFWIIPVYIYSSPMDGLGISFYTSFTRQFRVILVTTWPCRAQPATGWPVGLFESYKTQLKLRGLDFGVLQCSQSR